jgi:alkylated DNA repair dioxygenase AlkB
MSTMQLTFGNAFLCLPPGFQYRADLIPRDWEPELMERFRKLDFREFEFHGYRGKRRVVSFGLHYDFDEGTVRPAESVPTFLMPLREVAAEFARIAPTELEHALVIEYTPGAGIGWHKDRPVFGDVIGISFGSPCTFRLRRKKGIGGWERASLTLEPRSAYLLRGPVRTDWEHSIPPAEGLRYSVTFRTLKGRADATGRS